MDHGSPLPLPPSSLTHEKDEISILIYTVPCPSPHSSLPKDKIPLPNTAIPPLPPLPPLKLFKSSKPTSIVHPPPPMPYSKETTHKKPFQSFHMFFYGSLMDAEVLQAILDLPELPTTRPASILGFCIKMWGLYPTLLPGPSGSVTAGTVWELTSEDHFDRLADYESSVYTWTECDAVLDDGEVLKKCRTFCWAGKPTSEELTVGKFDLEEYQTYFKSELLDFFRH